MARTLSSPEYILPLRFTLHIPNETPLCFSVLDFPHTKAITAFVERFKAIYGKDLPYELRLPYRQLNDALLALAPGLIQGFESTKDGDETTRRMVAFTHFENGHAEDFPRLDQLTALIRIWLERWAVQPGVQAIIRGDGKTAWQNLLGALSTDPETDWEHGIPPFSLATEPGQKGALGYVALPALLAALLHERTMTIERPPSKGALSITWRRANNGGKNGLHLVSERIRYRDDYFAYRLDFSVQTQAGYAGSWIFARLGIQRYIGERYRNDPQKRATSILAGHNRERFTGGWDTDTTLIRLPVARKGKVWVWESGVGGLLDDFAVRRLESPESILNTPRRYGSYDNTVDGDEYYVVYAEGRKFGDASEHGRGHQIKTGVSLRERSQIMEGVMKLLDGWLEVSAPFQKDTQNPANTMALRHYDYMVDEDRQDNTIQQGAWRTALETSLVNSDSTYMHLVVLYRTPEFCQQAQKQINEALMGANGSTNPLVTVTYKPLPPLLYAPLDPGSLDPLTYFSPRSREKEVWMKAWRSQMRASYGAKRAEWRAFLQGLGWQPNARRLLLIDSTGERDKNMPGDQKIKGAVRDACHRENVLSQFIVGETLKLDRREAHKDELDGGSAGRLKNAVLDLMVRQQGILYAPPHEIYERAARLDAETAKQLDVITFCRVQHTKFPKLYYVLAVRLRAGGEVDVMLPDELQWTPYVFAAHTLGIIASEGRVPFANEQTPSRLRVGHQQMLNFVHDVLTKCLERPTLAVIEAEGWRNSRGWDEQNHCWTQLTNPNLFKYPDVLRFDARHSYDRAAPVLDLLLGVVRLRMNDETPQYVTAENWNAEASMRDIPHLTGYIDPQVPKLLHYFSVARLPELQKVQKDRHVMEAFRSDIRTHPKHDIAVKHPQLIEMVPFFVHLHFQSDEGRRQLCRCVHFLRNSPAFTMGEIALPYPMHLGEKLIRDQMVIIGADD